MNENYRTLFIFNLLNQFATNVPVIINSYQSFVNKYNSK